MKNYTAIVALALALPAGFASAQSPDESQRPPAPQAEVPSHPDRPPGPDRGLRPPLPPIIAALDKNHDGVISEDEIAAAAESLRTLDKNYDGKLTLDELMPPPPPRPMRDGQPRPPMPPPDGLREGGPRGELPRPRPPREGDSAAHFAPHPPMPSLDSTARENFASARSDRFAPPPLPPRPDRSTADRERFMPLPMPPRPDFAPREGELRERAMAARDDRRREFDRPPERSFGDRAELRTENRHERALPMPPMPPRDGFAPPREGDPRPEARGPRDGARPEARGPRDGVRPDGFRPDAGPRPERPPGERPPADAPRHDGNRPPAP